MTNPVDGIARFVTSGVVRGIAACFGVIFLSVQAAAHDVGDIEKELGKSEPYAQIVNSEAPGFHLQDPDGRDYSLEDFLGKVVVLYFIYSRCDDECPLHSLKIATVQKQAADASLGDQIQFIAVATDTESASSTAESMRSHGRKFGLDPVNWLFLYGGPGRETAGMTLARNYDLQFTPAGTDVQLHGVVTHLIDPEGRLRARYHGLDFDPLNLTVYAAALIHGEHGMADAGDQETGDGNFEMPYWAELLGGVLSLLLFCAAGWFYLREIRGKSRES